MSADQNPTGQPTVVCFGETMGMFTPTSSVPLDTAAGFTLGTGGAESNVAMHLAELGHRVAWVSNVGTDPVGSKIIDALAAANVDTRWVGRSADAPTGLYLKEPDTGSGAHVFYYRQGSAASALTITLGLASSIRAARLTDAKPPNTTECTAPIRVHASMANIASGIIGI